MNGKSFLGVALESHREGGRLPTLGGESTAVLLGLEGRMRGWTGTGPG